MVTVRIGDETVEMPMNEAVFRVLGEAALGGSRLARRHWARMVREIEAEQRRDQIAVHNAVVWPVGDSWDRTKRPIMADYGYEIITDRRTGVVVAGVGCRSKSQVRSLTEALSESCSAIISEILFHAGSFRFGYLLTSTMPTFAGLRTLGSRSLSR